MKYYHSAIYCLSLITTFSLNCYQDYELTSRLLSPEIQQSEIWSAHSLWIERLVDFIESQRNNEVVTFPRSKHHPIHFFNQHDARTLLVPLLKNTVGFVLTEDLITKCFKNELPPPAQGHATTSPDFFLQEHVKQHTLTTAEHVYDIVRGHTLLVIGQTPAYLGHMVITLAQLHDDTHTRIINVPLSGRPDFARKLHYRSLYDISFFDLVTRDRELNYRALLTTCGVSPTTLATEKIYILDNTTGSSMACFWHMMCRWLQEEEEEEEAPLPPVTVLNMCSADDLTVQDDTGIWRPLKKPNFSVSPDISFDLPVIFLDMEDDIVVAFDKVKGNLRVAPRMNSIYWNRTPEEICDGFPTAEARMLMSTYREFTLASAQLARH